MSSFMLSNKSISAIARTLTLPRSDWRFRKANEQKLANHLHKMNLNAVNYRYDEKNMESFEFKQVLPLSDLQLYKSIKCFLYQCTEGDIPNKKLFKALKGVSEAVAFKIISRLPGWQNCEWA